MIDASDLAIWPAMTNDFKHEEDAVAACNWLERENLISSVA